MLPDKLEDVLAPGLRVVFCGTAAGKKSADEREYYAGRGNRFWEILQTVGLTPTQLRPEEYVRVLEYGIGLTDMAKKHSGVDAQIPADAFDPDEVRRNVMLYEPQLLSFNGKKAASVFYGQDTSKINYGPQELWIGETQVWVLPNTSSAGNRWWDEEWWHKLAAQINGQR